MENIGQRIRKLREAKGWTLWEMAQEVGVHLSHIHGVEIGKHGMSFEVLERVANVFGVGLADLLGIGGAELRPVGLHPIPLVSRIPAGDPKEYMNGDYPAGWAEEFVPCPEDVKDPWAFGLTIEGNSMEPRFHEGDIVIISPNSGLKDGAPVVYRLKNGDCAVKNYHGGQNGEIILCPENLKTGGIEVFQPGDFVWVYRVVKSVRTEF